LNAIAPPCHASGSSAIAMLHTPSIEAGRRMTHTSLACHPMTLDGPASRSCFRFLTGDKVRSQHGGVVMHVVAVLDELVYCEYLIGTEPHRRTIRASELGLVFRDLKRS
jgi:hypothetical protein